MEPLKDLSMTDTGKIEAAVKRLEQAETYKDVGIASIPDTLENIILAKPEVALLKSDPSFSTGLLISRLDALPFRQFDFPRIAFFVALGHLGEKEALPVLADYLMKLPDESRKECHYISHPFRYAIRAIERISGRSLGLGPREDLPSLFLERHKIAGSVLNENRDGA
jgi:hypothetical protein